jgi:DNA-binding transcriptional MerR regulator
MDEKTYDISELSMLSEVSERTIRFYTTRGLLPRPNGRGRRTSYSDDHLNRLILIRRLQEGHMPLGEIGEFIKELEDREAAGEPADREGFRWPFDPHAAADAVLQQMKGAAATAANIPAQLVPGRGRSADSGGREVGERERWEHVYLGPGMELLVSSPRSKRKDAAVDRFVALARELFPEDAG